MKISMVTLVCLTVLSSVVASALANPQDFELFATGTFPDKTDRSMISVEGRFGHGNCYTAHARGDTLLTGLGPVLEILDFSNPDNPVRLGNVLLPGEILSIFSGGSIAYVYSKDLGLALIDIMDLGAPQIISVVALEDRVYGQEKQGDLTIPCPGSLRVENSQRCRPNQPF